MRIIDVCSGKGRAGKTTIAKVSLVVISTALLIFFFGYKIPITVTQENVTDVETPKWFDAITYPLSPVVYSSKATNNSQYNVSFVDFDYNSVDRIEWIVPELSEQIFEVEVDLTIIDVQSYPTLYGNWTVRFNTTGTANLTIRAVNGTEFGVDLKFLELRCGDRVLTTKLTNGVVFVENYSCGEIGYMISEVLTAGEHTLEFRFGNDGEYAYNQVVGNKYIISIGPIAGSTAAGYVYASLFNPADSGKTIVIKKISIRVDAVAAGVYTGTKTLRRISAASGGTLIAADNIPKKDTGSASPVLEVRHTGVSVTWVGTADSRLLSVVPPAAAGQLHGYKEIVFGDEDEKLILKPGEGVALYQEAAGDADERVRLLVEWEEVTTTPLPQGEYLFTSARVEVAATAGYVYHSFFNPSGSGKTAIVKRIGIQIACDAAAVYTNNIAIRRITSASGGTPVDPVNIPKKHSDTPTSVMDIRRAGPTVTFVGSVHSRIMMVTPCGAAGEAIGIKEVYFGPDQEKLILKPGEGIALYSEGTGDADQIVQLFVEWDEETTTPASQGEYMITYPRAEKKAAAGEAFHTFFNPSTSGRTAIIKRIEIRVDPDAAAIYQPITVRRITSATGGTIIIAPADVPKKHSDTPTTAMELRTTGATAITVTYAGTVNSRLLSVTGPGVVGQLHAQKEIVFRNVEKIILKPGEGIALYSEAGGDADQYVKFSVEWDEETTTPPAEGEYMITTYVTGSTTSGYNYASFFNPSTSGKTAIVKRVWIGVDTIGPAVYIPFTLRRITSASGGTLIPVADVPKKHSDSPTTVMDIRVAGPTVTFVGTAASRLVGVQSPGVAATAVAPQLTGHKELFFENDEKIILKPGEGFALYQEAAGDADFRVKLLVEWDEETTTPASHGDYLMSIGPVAGSLASGYVYASIFNPSTSDKSYTVKRIEIRADRIGALTAPGYIPITVRKITAASGGTLIPAAEIPKKHTDTADTTAEIRHTGVTVTLWGVADSRIVGVTAPGAVGQAYGDYENVLVFGDELILSPGEGLALFQEAAAGDVNLRYRFAITWNERILDTIPPTYSLNSTNSTQAGTPVSHNLFWQDNVGLSYAIFSFDNCTGTLVNITGMMLSGTEGWSNFTVVINSTVGCTVRWRVFANDTRNNWNVSEIFSYITTPPPYLEVTLIIPDPTATTNVIQNSTFWVNASVTCRYGDCGNVNGTVRYNSTSAYPDTQINETYGATPFFINETPPQAMKSCGTLLQDQPCILTWLINATGSINSGWKIGVLFNSSLASVQQNHTNNATVVIVDCTVDFTLTWFSINFGELIPNTYNNSAPGNSNNEYNITVNPGSCNLDLYINGTDLVNSTFNSVIKVGNISWSNISSNINDGFFPLSYSYSLIRLNVPAGTNVTTWYWLNVPPVYAGYYNATIYIKGVRSGEAP